MNIIMSIKPQYANRILNGSKTFEFRKTVAAKIEEVEKVYIYSTNPVKKITGHFTVKKVHRMAPIDLWLHTWRTSGIDIEEFQAYFNDKEFGYAIEIDKVVEYEEPLPFIKVDPTGKIPQSFKYI